VPFEYLGNKDPSGGFCILTGVVMVVGWVDDWLSTFQGIQDATMLLHQNIFLSYY
jgi:hypothetical protein